MQKHPHRARDDASPNLISIMILKSRPGFPIGKIFARLPSPAVFIRLNRSADAVGLLREFRGLPVKQQAAFPQSA
jgi:hypothetical protein